MKPGFEPQSLAPESLLLPTLLYKVLCIFVLNFNTCNFSAVYNLWVEVKEFFFALLHFGTGKGIVVISLDMAKSMQGKIMRLIIETRERVARGMVGRSLGWGGKEMEKGV